MNKKKITNRELYKNSDIKEKVTAFYQTKPNGSMKVIHNKVAVYKGEIKLGDKTLYETDIKQSRQAIRQSFLRWYEKEV